MEKKSHIKTTVIYTFVFLLYTAAMCVICRFIGIDSDKANHLLQAKDIVHGNFFLKDWVLTGITFLTTDLVFYEVAELLFGVSYRAIYFAGGLMIATALFISYFVSFTGIERKRGFRKALCVLLLLIPCRNLVASFRVHTGAVILCLLVFLLFYIISDKGNNRKRYYLAYSVAIFMGAFGDFLFIVEGVIPIILLSVLKIANVGKEDRKKYGILAAISALFTGIALKCQDLYLLYGGAYPNSYIGKRHFTPVSEWVNKLLSFINNLMQLSLADFAGNRMGDKWVLLRGINFFILIVEVFFVVLVLIKLFKGEKVDTVSALLSLGIVLSSAAFIFTELSEPRYITLIPIAGALVVIRNIEWVYKNFQNEAFVSILVLLICTLGFAVKAQEVRCYDLPVSDASDFQLISFLEEHDLEYGYASFWNASNITVLSGENVKIRHIIETDGTYTNFHWFNKNCWYQEPTNFVVINNSANDTGNSDIFRVNEAGIIDFFGAPTERYRVANYIVLVYDEIISEKLAAVG